MKLSPRGLNQEKHWLFHFLSSHLILLLTYLKSALTPLCWHTKYCTLIHYIYSTNSSNRKLKLQSCITSFRQAFP